MAPNLKEILKLSVAERILLVEAIWDSIASDPTSSALSEEHKNILDERMEDYRANPDSGSSWEEVKTRIQKK